MRLSTEVQINAFIMIIATIFVSILILHILVRAKQTEERKLYVLAICFASTITPWIPGVLDYLYWLFTNNLIINYQFYVIVGTAFIPIAFFCWMYIYSITIIPKRKKTVFIIFGLMSILMDSVLIYFLYFAPNAPVEEVLPIVVPEKLDHFFTGLILIITLIIIIVVVISGVHFGLRAIIKTEEKTLLWRGRFIMISFSLFSTTIPDIVTANQFILIPMRILQMFFFFFLYLGFVLPNWIKPILRIS